MNIIGMSNVSFLTKNIQYTTLKLNFPDINGDDELTDAQLYSVVRVCQILTKYFDIKLLGGHRDYGNSVCPGDILYNQIPMLRNRTSLGGP